MLASVFGHLAVGSRVHEWYMAISDLFYTTGGFVFTSVGERSNCFTYLPLVPGVYRFGLVVSCIHDWYMAISDLFHTMVNTNP